MSAYAHFDNRCASLMTDDVQGIKTIYPGGPGSGQLSIMTSSLPAISLDRDYTANLEASGGLVFSQRVLLALTAAGMGREEAYAVVQSCAMRAWEGGGTFRDLLAAEPAVRERLGEGLAACFDVAFYLGSVDALFARAEAAVAGDAP